MGVADGLSDAAMQVGANAIRAALGGAQLHHGDPGSGGAANKSSAPMLAPTWSTVTADGDFGLAASLNFTGGTPGGPCTYMSLWSNTSGSGTWYGNVALTGDTTFDSEGNYTVNAGVFDGSAS
jgi:hypothetical protein